jgi:hypothetical protein
MPPTRVEIANIPELVKHMMAALTMSEFFVMHVVAGAGIALGMFGMGLVCMWTSEAVGVVWKR